MTEDVFESCGRLRAILVPGDAALEPAGIQQGKANAFRLDEKEDVALGFDVMVPGKRGQCVLSVGDLPAHRRCVRGRWWRLSYGSEPFVNGGENPAFRLVTAYGPEEGGEEGLEQTSAHRHRACLEGLHRWQGLSRKD